MTVAETFWKWWADQQGNPWPVSAEKVIRKLDEMVKEEKDRAFWEGERLGIRGAASCHYGDVVHAKELRVLTGDSCGLPTCEMCKARLARKAGKEKA